MTKLVQIEAVPPTGDGAYTALADSGDHRAFTSAASLWSGASGFAPTIRPNGMVTPGYSATDPMITPAASGSDNVVDLKAMTVYIGGELKSIAAQTDVTCARGATNGHITHSLTVTSDGTFAVVSGSEHTAASTTRGAPGGPPWIPTVSVEVGQVVYSDTVAAAVLAAEIRQTPGIHQERYDSPTWNELDITARAGVRFDAALAAIHSDDAGSTTAGKAVYASYYEPQFVDLPGARDYVPTGETKTTGSEQFYGLTAGYVTSALNAGSLTVLTKDGITDVVSQAEGDTRWTRMYPDQNMDPHYLDQGIIGIVRALPTEGVNTLTVSIAPQVVGTRNAA